MKITLPVLLLLALTIQAQTQINALNGGNSLLEPTEGYNYRFYITYEPTTIFDQSSAGFNQVWNISGFSAIPDQTKVYENAFPTPEQLAEYPGTGMVTTGSIAEIENAILDKVYTTPSLSNMTGYANGIFLLYYTTDDANYGVFPMVYGDLHFDTVAGNYSYGEYSGTFEGTMVTEVDAYGTIITQNEGNLLVTRLKTIQTLQINYPGFGNVGTFVQTTYRYYRENDLWPFVKSTNDVLNVDLLGININTTAIEKATAGSLSINNPRQAKDLAIVPNPVSDETEIVASGQNVLSVILTDASGKEVFTKKGTTHLDLNTLPTGTYLARIQTSEGISVKKIIKK